MRIYDAGQTAALLPYPQLASSIRRVLDDAHAGRTTAPERASLPLPGGVLLLMPATDGEIAVTKLVSVHGANPGAGLPAIQGEVVVMRAGTGERLAILDGVTVTARRTAAVSALAATRLALAPGGQLLIAGAGVQGRSHLEAFREVMGVRRVVVYARRPAAAEQLAAYARELGLEANVAVDLAEAVRTCTLAVTVTPATSPILPDTFRDDAFVAAVGSFRPEMVELPASLVQRALLYADTVEGARTEAGDFLQAGVDWSRVTGLEDALLQPPPASGPVVFKSVGCALWDLAAARCAIG